MSMQLASCHLARLHLERGEADLAHVAASALVAGWGDRHEGLLVPYARQILVESSILRGDLDEAASSIAALRSFEPIGPIAGAMASLGEAKVLLARHDPAGAAKAAEAALASCARLGVAPFESMRLAHAEALLGAGRMSEAKDALRAARADVLSRAALIDEAPHRARFVERVAVNARILALARQWLGD
jgi:hypothetical protein